MSYRKTLDLDDLKTELDDLRERENYAAENPDADDAEPLDNEERIRLVALEELESDLGDLHVASRNLSDFIHEDDWEDYAAEQAEELIFTEARYSCYLDREKWADDLRSDYSSVDFDGETYYYQG